MFHVFVLPVAKQKHWQKKKKKSSQNIKCFKNFLRIQCFTQVEVHLEFTENNCYGENRLWLQKKKKEQKNKSNKNKTLT